MAYDNFENTPFDLNHDGNIDSNEAAHIYETFYKEQDEGGSSADMDGGNDIGGGGWYPTKEELKKHNADMEKLRRDVKAERSGHILITIVVIAAVWLLIGNNIIGSLVLFGLFILGTVFDFWK